MSRRRHPAYRHPGVADRHGHRRGLRRYRRRGALALALRLPPALLVAGGIIAVGGVAMAATMVALFMITVLPGLLFGLVVVLVAQQHRAARRRRLARALPPPAPVLQPPRLDVAWRRARERFATVRAEYACYECDAMNVLRLPALADVSVPSTARFVDAFAHAQALETDALPPPQHAAEFVAAVDRAARAWRAACDAAERIRLSGLSDTERSGVERAIKLLTTARDSDSDAERLAAYALARSELAKLEKAGVVHVPRPAQATLDAAARGQLPAA